MLLACVAVLAFFNGANDVSKSIATLVGSGITRFKTAVIWGTFWMLAGGCAAAFAAQGMVMRFSGNGILSPFPDGNNFLISVALGASLWIGFATRTGMPVSTTHAITGALIGAGWVGAGLAGIHWSTLGSKFLLPLAVSPLLSLAAIYALSPAFNFILCKLQKYCVCLQTGVPIMAAQPAANAEPLFLATASEGAFIVGQTSDCQARATTGAGLNLMDALHWLSAGASAFARGLNDAPKILALGLAANLAYGFSSSTGFFLIAAAMGAGSVVAGFRVTETLARKVTRMAPSEGFAANLVTSLIVIAASSLALPVSTTHVSSAAIIGLGLKRDAGSIHWGTVREMLLAWAVTLPAAGICAALIYLFQVASAK